MIVRVKEVIATTMAGRTAIRVNPSTIRRASFRPALPLPPTATRTAPPSTSVVSGPAAPAAVDTHSSNAVAPINNVVGRRLIDPPPPAHRTCAHRRGERPAGHYGSRQSGIDGYPLR